MSPPSATTSRVTAEYRSPRGGSRGSGRAGGGGRRPAPARRRRLIRLTAALVAIGVLVAVTLPMAQRAVVSEFGLPLQYAATIRAQAARKHLPADLIAAVIYAETKFDPRTSPTGAVGLMQVEPQTALYLANRSGATAFSTADLNHPATNIAYGSYYLRFLLDEYHGSKVLALAAYNGGAANVNGWEANARAHGHTLRISDIPFPETRAYVAKVLGAQRDYRRKYARQLGYD